jgi:hypothetical protein
MKRMLAALLGAAMLVFGLVAVATPASAAEGASWGFLYLDNGAIPVGVEYTPPPSRQASNAGIPGTVLHTAVGRYTVTLPGVHSPDLGTAHVTSDVENVQCEIQGSYVFGDDVQVGVACRNIATTALTDGRFGVAVATATAPAASGLPGAYASLSADQPTDAQYTPAVAFTSNGIAPVVTKVPGTTGRWQVRLGGAEFATPGGTVQVTPFFTTAHCVAADWTPDATGLTISVNCRTPGTGGTPTDNADFLLTYARERSLTGNTQGQYAYLRTDQPRPGPFWFNSAGDLPTVTRSGRVGVYDVVTPIAAVAPFTVQVTTVQPLDAACSTSGWYIGTGPVGQAAFGQVICRAGGVGAWADFSLVLSTSP